MDSIVRGAVVETSEKFARACGSSSTTHTASTAQGVSGAPKKPCPSSPSAVDVVLMDLGLPGMSGIEAVRLVKERHPGLKLVALTGMTTTNAFLTLVRRRLRYVLKNTAPARLFEYRQEAAARGAPISPAVASRVVALFREFNPPARAPHRHAPRRQSAAAVVGSSVNTLAFHMKNTCTKLQVHSKSAAVAKALRDRIVP